MEANNKTNQQSSAYDRIIKEREADLICDVIDAKGNRYILHLEYQTSNDPLMLYRMAEYSIMLQRKFKLPVEQYVLYTGSRKMTMKNTIRIKDMNYRYNLISTNDLQPEVFLNAHSPEMKTQVVWSKLTKKQAEDYIMKVVTEIADQELGELERKKLFDQLHYFCKLRNFENLLNIAMNNVRLTRKQIENDPFWIQGMEKGVKKGLTETAKRMKALNYDNQIIADITKLPLKQIEKI